MVTPMGNNFPPASREVKKLSCPSCGAPFNKEESACSYCGSELYIDEMDESALGILQKGNIIKCPQCKTVNNVGEAEQKIFCKSCGKELLFDCPICKGVHTYDTRFCNKTGKNIKEYLDQFKKKNLFKQELARIREAKARLLAQEGQGGKGGVTIAWIISIIAGFFMWLIPSGLFLEITDGGGGGEEGNCIAMVVVLMVIPAIVFFILFKFLSSLPYYKRKKELPLEKIRLQTEEDKLVLNVQGKNPAGPKNCKFCGHKLDIGITSCSRCKKDLFLWY